MEIYNNSVQQKYRMTSAVQKSQFEDKVKKRRTDIKENEKLRSLSQEFTSLLLQQMFKSMRSTLPEDKLFSGGFAEDVFTDMYDQEISKMGSKQQSFNQLSEILYRQLLEKQGE